MKASLCCCCIVMASVLTYCRAQLPDRDIHEAMLGVTNKLHGDHCVVVLIFDDSMSRVATSKLIMNLQKNDTRSFLTLDLMLEAEEKETTPVDPVTQLSNYLHKLYRLNRCYTFLVWIHDPDILYPTGLNIHPGWRAQDVLIFAAHNSPRKISNLRFWGAIPNVLGLRRPRYNVRQESNRVSIFTVFPYTKTEDGPFLKEIDFWLVREKKFERNVTLLWDKFTSFQGSPIRICILWKAPYYIFGDANNPFVDGIDWRLLLLVFKHLHFTFDITTLVSTSTSGRNYDGNWTGVFHHLQTGRADLGVGGLSTSGQRLADFDFTTSYYGDAYVFIGPIKTMNPKVLDIFAKPLDRQVWSILFLTSLLVAVTLKYISKFERKCSKTRAAAAGGNDKNRDHSYTSVSHNIYFFYNAFCQKPFPHVPRSNALRLIFLGSSLSITVIGIIFAGSLFSQLFHARKEVYIDSFDEMLDSGLPVCIMNYDGSLNYGMTRVRRRSLKAIWANGTLVDHAGSVQCIDNVVRGIGVYIDAYSRLHFLGSYQHMGVNGIKFHFGRERLLYQVNMGWPTRKRWPFLGKISRILSRAVESGLVDHWMSNFKRGHFGWDKESVDIRLLDPNFRFPPIQNGTMDIDPTVNLSSKNRFLRLSFLQFNTVLAMWVHGMIISIVIFLGELATHGTWTIAAWIKRLFRWGTALFKAKKLESQLQLFERVLEPDPKKRTRKSRKRKRVDGTRYFVWNDLTQGSREDGGGGGGGVMDPVKPGIKIKKT